MKTETLQSKIFEILLTAIREIFGQTLENLVLDFPPSIDMGDFCFNCFTLAKQFKQPPAQIAERIASVLQSHPLFEKATAVGPYVNLKLPNQMFFETICKNPTVSFLGIGDGQKVMVEYLSPNTNKPLHLGHVRNGTLGMAVANILQAVGCQVIKSNLINDRGIHICKSMLAWQRWGADHTPQDVDIKGDHFVGRWYVCFAQELEKNPGLEDEAQEMLRRWEAGDREILALWQMMNDWVYEGFAQTYRAYGYVFDKFYYESETYKFGKDVVAKGLEQGIFSKDENGAVIVNLPIDLFGPDSHGQTKKTTVLRADGTSVYMTQDLGTAPMKFQDYPIDRSIYVVGSEQDHHFKCLFWILKTLGFEWADNCQHLSYGMVYLPEGKMKSREGTVVDADDLLEQMTEMALEEIQKRHGESAVSREELETRARKIALGAIKFYLLQFSPRNDIHFDPASSLSFEGCTGPYCQYTYARASAILRKVNQDYSQPNFGQLGNNEELLLAQKLIVYPEQIRLAAQELNPSRITTYVYELAKAFNQFYEKHPVLNASGGLAAARVELVKATLAVLKSALNLLGIEEIEQM